MYNDDTMNLILNINQTIILQIVYNQECLVLFVVLDDVVLGVVLVLILRFVKYAPNAKPLANHV